jgi:hypothetical protein
MFSTALLIAYGQNGATGEDAQQLVVLVRRSTCATTIKRLKVVVLHVWVQRKSPLHVRSLNAPSMVSGVIGQTGVTAVKNVDQESIIVSVRSRCSLSTEVSQSLALTRRKKAANSRHVPLHVKYLIGKTLVSAPNAVEVVR